MVFATGLGNFIAQTDLRNLIMASAALAVYPSCSLAEIAILESGAVARQPCVTAARSFGFSGMRIFWSYIFRTSVLPWFGHLTNVAASLVTGSIVVEVVFSLPGLGRLVIQSVLRSDFPMMQAVVITGVMSFLVINFATEQAVARFFSAHR
jgi:peptide/nickel transport system permease protein